MIINLIKSLFGLLSGKNVGAPKPSAPNKHVNKNITPTPIVDVGV